MPGRRTRSCTRGTASSSCRSTPSTSSQRLVDRRSFAAARTILLMPDLVGYWLTGVMAAERTNASTTGLLDPTTREWAWDLIDDLELPRELFPPLRDPGDDLGRIRPEVAASTGVSELMTVTLVGSHDTASAVVGVPAVGRSVRLHLVRDVVARRRRARPADPDGGEPGGELHQRGVVSTGASGSCATSWACGCSRSRCGPGTDAAPRRTSIGLLAAAAALPRGGPVIDPDDACVPGARRHADADRGRLPTNGPARARVPARPGAVHPRQPRAGVRPGDRRCRSDSPASDVTAVHLVGGGASQRARSASSRPTLAACRSSPARSRRPRSATSWSRPARGVSWRAVSRRCARSSGGRRPPHVHARARIRQRRPLTVMVRRRVPRWSRASAVPADRADPSLTGRTSARVGRDHLGSPVGRSTTRPAGGLRLHRRRRRDRDEPAPLARGLRAHRVRPAASCAMYRRSTRPRRSSAGPRRCRSSSRRPASRA